MSAGLCWSSQFFSSIRSSLSSLTAGCFLRRYDRNFFFHTSSEASFALAVRRFDASERFRSLDCFVMLTSCLSFDWSVRHSPSLSMKASSISHRSFCSSTRCKCKSPCASRRSMSSAGGGHCTPHLVIQRLSTNCRRQHLDRCFGALDGCIRRALIGLRCHLLLVQGRHLECQNRCALRACRWRRLFVTAVEDTLHDDTDRYSDANDICDDHAHQDNRSHALWFYAGVWSR